MIWCIVPFTRERLFSNVLANFARQRYENKRLLIVRDGEGPLRTSELQTELGDYQVIELCSGRRGISEALNAGLAYARERSGFGAQFAKLDDDDWYGPEYLSRIPAGYSACGSWWVRTEEGRYWFVAPERGLHGSTLAGPLDCPDFLHVRRWGEDTLWIVKVGRQRFEQRPAGHYCYQRFGHDHAWPVPTVAIPSPAFSPVLDCGRSADLTADRPESGSPVKELDPLMRLALCRKGAERAIRR